MKRLLNTLYITSQGAYLTREGETVIVRVGHETRLQVPVHTLDGIVCFGQVACSPPLMELCGKRKVTISFLSQRGRFWARVQGPTSGNVLLRREQYRRADDTEQTAMIARTLVTAKVANSKAVLLRALRDHPGIPKTSSIEAATHEITRILDSLRRPVAVDALRGCEGEASRIYFGVFDHLIVSQKEDFVFRERSRRPPLDNINALLSFLYTLLTHDMTSALEGVGLDPAVGFLHRDRPGRPSLALDLIEELRPFLADRLALSLVNRHQVKASGFQKTETGAVTMDDATRKQLLVAYQNRKQETLRHPFLGEEMQVGLIPHVQALLLARYLRGDLDGYPPFLWR